MKTAVEFIRQEFLEKLTNENYKKSFDTIIKQAKEIEKQQIIDACINTTKDCFISAMHYMNQEIVFTEQDLINQRNEAEQYYNETFKNK